MTKYSAAEEKLFKALGLEHLLKAPILAVGTYRLAIEEAFINNLQGPAVDALRRAGKSMQNSTPYRFTTAFDALIAFEETK